MRFVSFTFLAAVILAQSASAFAHHAQAPFFHQDRTVEVKGTVQKWLFANPHPVLFVEAEENGQKVVWQIQFAPASVLGKRGWSKMTFQPGETVIASGHPSKAPGTHGMEIGVITRGDGSPVR
jgi:hypothetical protein